MGRDKDNLEIVISIPEIMWDDWHDEQLFEEIRIYAKDNIGLDVVINEASIGRGASGLAISININYILQLIGNAADMIGFAGGIVAFLAWLNSKMKKKYGAFPIYSVGMLKLLCIEHVLRNESFCSVELISFEELAGEGSQYEGYDYYSCIIIIDRERQFPKINTIILNAFGHFLASNIISIDRSLASFTKAPLFKVVKNC